MCFAQCPTQSLSLWMTRGNTSLTQSLDGDDGDDLMVALFSTKFSHE